MGTKKPRRDCSRAFHGDPYGNRTHVTAVKGRCLNRLTNGPGSGNLIRTDDIPGMNRLLYQLSYAAMWSMQFRHRRNSFCIISDTPRFVKTFFAFFENFPAAACGRQTLNAQLEVAIRAGGVLTEALSELSAGCLRRGASCPAKKLRKNAA